MRQVQCEKVWDLEICRNINRLKDADKIIIYGAAEKGREIFGWLEDAGLKIDFFCDRNMSIWGNYFENTEIISPFKLKDISLENEGSSIYVIACILHPQEILTLFSHMGKSRSIFLFNCSCNSISFKTTTKAYIDIALNLIYVIHTR